MVKLPEEYIKPVSIETDLTERSKNSAALQVFNEWLKIGSEAIILVPVNTARQLHQKAIEILTDHLQEKYPGKKAEGIFLDLRPGGEAGIKEAEAFLAEHPQIMSNIQRASYLDEFFQQEDALPILTVVIEPDGPTLSIPEPVTRMMKKFCKFGNTALVMATDSRFFAQPEQSLRLERMVNDPYGLGENGLSDIITLGRQLVSDQANPIHRTGMTSRLDNYQSIITVDPSFYNLSQAK